MPFARQHACCCLRIQQVPQPLKRQAQNHSSRLSCLRWPALADPIRARALLLLAGVECNAFETTVNPSDNPQLPPAPAPSQSAKPSTLFILALQFAVKSPSLVQVTPAAAAPDKCSGMLKILLDYPVSLCTSLGIFTVGALLVKLCSICYLSLGVFEICIQINIIIANRLFLS
jgi:hypothetical protein